MKGRKRELLDLLDTAGPRLHALLMRLTLREDVAEELMQEMFLRLMHSDGFAKATNPAAYAARTAMHLAFRWRKKRSRRPLPIELAAEPASNEPSPLHRLIDSEQLEQTLEALGKLTPVRRDVFVMRFIHQATYAEIADQLGRTPHQARALCSKAVAQLRKQLNQAAACEQKG